MQLERKLARLRKENDSLDEQIKTLSQETEELQWQIESQETARQKALKDEQDRQRELQEIDDKLKRIDAQIKSETTWISQ